MTLNVDNDDFLKFDLEDFGDNELSYFMFYIKQFAFLSLFSVYFFYEIRFDF